MARDEMRKDREEADRLRPVEAQHALPVDRREGKELIDASRPFAIESPARSWAHLLSTLVVLAFALQAAALLEPWWARTIAATLAGLVIVRGFILYHDHMHSALLRKSKIARAIMHAYGVFVLTPPRVWKATHNYHHANNCKVVGSHVGSYPIVTVAIWRAMTPRQRAMYRASRHPLTILFAYFTVFLFGMCLSSFFRRPKEHWDSFVSVAVHAGLIALLTVLGGFELAFFALILPLMVACTAGAYLFYVQHNFEGMAIQSRTEWTYTKAALESSSYLAMGPVMRWFTGNIGYHHVHHLNPKIPFYRLPEAMARIPELSQPPTVHLTMRDIADSFRLAVWDPEKGRMLGYREANEALSAS